MPMHRPANSAKCVSTDAVTGAGQGRSGARGGGARSWPRLDRAGEGHSVRGELEWGEPWLAQSLGAAGQERTRRSTRVAKMLIMASTSPLLWLAGERLGVTLEKKPGEVPQRGGREQEQVRARFSRCPPGGRDGQVGPPPGHCYQGPRATPQQHPRRALTPEDLAHPPRRATVRTLFCHDRRYGVTKCNIRCCLSWG
jgi:hypothetical protein